MNIFTNKSIWKKIAIALVIVILFEFMVSSPVHAEEDFLASTGGKLISPIFSLLVSIGDGIMGILHSSIMGVDNTLIEIGTVSDWVTAVLKVVSVIIAAACIIGAIIFSGGVALVLGLVGALAIAQTIFTGSNFIYQRWNRSYTLSCLLF